MFGDLNFIDQPTEWAIWVIAISIAVIAITFLWEPFYGYLHRVEISVRTERGDRSSRLQVLERAVNIILFVRRLLGGEVTPTERAALHRASLAAVQEIHNETGGGAVEPAHSSAPEPGVMHTLTIQGVDLQVRYDGHLVGGEPDHGEEGHI